MIPKSSMPSISLNSGLITLAVLIVLWLLIAVLYRRVVTTNMVHIVQRGHSTTTSGTGLAAGNVCYSWPSWSPRIGVNVIKLPVSNFDLTLENYEAHDTDRVPFVVHVNAFFRIKALGSGRSPCRRQTRHAVGPG